MYQFELPENNPPEAKRPLIESVYAQLEKLRFGEMSALAGSAAFIVACGDMVLKSCNITVIPDVVDTSLFIAGIAGVAVGGVSVASVYAPPQIIESQNPTSETE